MADEDIYICPPCNHDRHGECSSARCDCVSGPHPMTTDSVPAHNDREKLIGLLRRVNTADNSEYLVDYLLSSDWLSSLLATARADGAREAAITIREEVSRRYADLVPSGANGLMKLTLRQLGVWIDARLDGRAPLTTVVPLTTEEKK